MLSVLFEIDITGR